MISYLQVGNCEYKCNEKQSNTQYINNISKYCVQNLCNIVIRYQDCRCENFINAGGWGNCIKKENHEALCYVKDPSSSTCKDLQDSVSNIGKKWSFEACSKGGMIDSDNIKNYT